MEKTSIKIEELTARGIDVLLHTSVYNDEPEIRTTQAGKKEYVIKRVRNGYISLKSRQTDMSTEEAPLPYYSSNIRDLIQLCERQGISWTINYVDKSNNYLASVGNIHYVYRTAAGALSRAALIYQIKKKFMDSVTIYYRVLDRTIEL